MGEVKHMKKAIQIKEDIYWVGVRDFNNRHFHGSLYPIQEGATYNAYLVVDVTPRQELLLIGPSYGLEDPMRLMTGDSANSLTISSTLS